MSSGKGGSQTTTVELSESVKAQAEANMKLAEQVGSLPYAPYFGGSVAAFTPGQQAGFNNMNSAASAFGMQGGAGQGMPKAQNFGGIQGYSTEGAYKDAMGQVDPAVMELYKSFFFPHNTAAVDPAKTPIAAKQTGVTTGGSGTPTGYNPSKPSGPLNKPNIPGIVWNKQLGAWTRPRTAN